MLNRLLAVVCVPVFVVLASCSQSGSIATVNSEVANQLPAQTSTGLISIQSDNVAAAGYDPATQTMTVKFLEGAVYQYAPVTQSIWDDFLAAQPHPWSAVGYPRLVEANVPYWRLS